MKHLLHRLSLALPPLLLLAATPAFDTNDDAVSMFTACGFWTGQPDETLIFISTYLGRVLCRLYEGWPAPNWYVCFQYAVLLAAHTVVLASVARPQCSPRAGMAGLLWTLVFFLPALLRPQYTITACWAGLAGWLLLVQGLRKPGLSPLHFPGAAIFLLLSALIRWQALAGLGLLLSALSLLQVFEKKRWPIRWPHGLKKTGLAALVLLLPAGLAWQENRGRPENASLSYQNAIDAVVNGPNCLDAVGLQAAGFSANDLGLLQKWFWIDGRIFAPEKIENLSRGIRCPRSWKDGLRHFAGALYLEWWHLTGAAAGALLLGMFGPENRRRALFAAGVVALLFLLLSFWSRLPHRILFPLLAAAFAWLWVTRTPPRVAEPKPPWWVYPALAGLFLFQGIYLWLQNAQNRLARQEFQDAAAWTARQPETLVVVQGGSFPYEGAFSWQNPALRWSSHNLVPTGYLLHTPVYRDILRYHGLEDLAAALSQKHPLVLLNPPVDRLRVFYLEHYGRDIQLRPVESGVRIGGQPVPAYVPDL